MTTSSPHPSREVAERAARAWALPRDVVLPDIVQNYFATGRLRIQMEQRLVERHPGRAGTEGAEVNLASATDETTLITAINDAA